MEGVNEMNVATYDEDAVRATIECLVIGGIGGTMPTLTRLSAALVADAEPALPSAGFFVGLAIYFLIGAVLVYAFSERSVKRAFLAGIAAPALIANVVAGVHDANEVNPSAVQEPAVERSSGAGIGSWLVGTAHAQELTGVETPVPQGELRGHRGNGEALPDQDRVAEGEQDEPPETGNTAAIADPDPGVQLEYTYRIDAQSRGAAELPIELRATQENGQIQSIRLGGHSQTELKTRQPITSIEVVAPGTRKTIPLTDEQKAGASFDIDTVVGRKRGLFWALGGGAEPIVEELRIEIAEPH